jgi:hypothetical protein
MPVENIHPGKMREAHEVLCEFSLLTHSVMDCNVGGFFGLSLIKIR